ncbi:MAG: polyribonucleotide nucleotidyltransferase, partial [Planctomycetota bacterium]
MRHVVSREVGGRTLTLETGVMAKQANGAVLVRYGDSAVFCAVTAGEPPAHLDFFPLTVDYREKTYAAGKIPGGFFKREGRPTTKEILTARLIDRPIRPLFPEGFRKDISVSAMVLSADRQNDPDILAMIGAFAALSISDVPFKGPLGGVRVGLSGDRFLINPTHEERESGDLDLVVAGSRDAIMMVECGAREVTEEKMLDGLEEAHRVIRIIADMIGELAELTVKPEMEWSAPETDTELEERVHELAFSRIKEAIRTPGKMAATHSLSLVRQDVLAELCPEEAIDSGDAPDPKVVKGFFAETNKKAERQLIINEKVRTDGRSFTDIRDINTDFALLPHVHGSALFTRGETQALVTVTLGTSFDEQRIDGLLDEKRETFLLHYNFPAFSVGETWPNRGPRRREIGHGVLAERALTSVLPEHDDFPYTIRLVSDVMESNGSSSMATVCGGTLSLMDAGVQIKRPVAGIAMGLVKEGEEFYILSDILGSEDHHGDMDFKVAGTQRGITALQMDIKISGLDRSILARALEQAREGRLHILREMLKDLQRPREQISPHAPKIIRIQINPEKIGIVIGPGGKMIKGIQEETGATIEIEDDGRVTIWGTSMESAETARAKIEMLTEEVEPGRTYTGRVVSIKDFGCFVEVLPGQEG